ncbi:MAG: FKBP-type peptidyl-prolyl cis-trans isomerase [Actinomycetota bacterium]|nr:FKBP-type peptidyl-prolyl cis-trans isomerase [Actinomycetota bacterium]
MTKLGVLFLSILILLTTACGGDDAGTGAATADESPEGECLVVEDTVEGEGKEATPGSIVTVHYTGTLEDGSEFDSSRGKEPFTFPLGGGQVIQGWDEGIVGMKVGGRRTLMICSDMAYGDEGYPGAIPGGATLTFDVELLKVRSPA